MQRVDQQTSNFADREGQAAVQYLHDIGHLLQQQVAAPSSPGQRQVRTRFGQYIRSARQYQGFSPGALAMLLGVAESEVVGLEAGLLPPTYIVTTLLPGLAQVLDEDPALLNQLLREGVCDRKDTHNFIHLTGWRRVLPAFLTAGGISVKALWDLCIVRVVDLCLQCGSGCNLLNRLQPSRLTLSVVTVLAAFLLSFLTVRWVQTPSLSIKGAFFPAATPSVALQQVAARNEQSYNPANGSLRGNAVAADLGISPAPGSGQLADPVHVVKSYQNVSYQIVYGPGRSSYRNERTAFITVDEAQVAMILLEARVVPSPQERCSTIGRFDLCPI